MKNSFELSKGGCFVPGENGKCAQVKLNKEGKPYCGSGDPNRCLDSPLRDPTLRRGEVGRYPGNPNHMVDGGTMRH